jgi:hypothetical protein
MSENDNDIVAPNMEHAYWGVKCKNPECRHYILREDLSLQPEGILGIPPEPYPNFDQACEHCGQTHMYARNDVQIVQGPEPAAAAETQLRAAQAHERQITASHEANDDDPGFGE